MVKKCIVGRIGKMDCQEQLNKWAVEYDTSQPVFDGYTEPTRKYAGRCKFRVDGNGIRYGIILIRPELEGHPANESDGFVKPRIANAIRWYLAKSVLWHEFNHHATWYNDCYTGHGGKWFKRLIKKPLLVIGEFGASIYLASRGRFFTSNFSYIS